MNSTHYFGDKCPGGHFLTKAVRKNHKYSKVHAVGYASPEATFITVLCSNWKTGWKLVEPRRNLSCRRCLDILRGET